ncbi:uncharacterized protein EV154DRAFT_541627 [Mucor mucedo]|uniref:uncharacterized protein n=1 Tax=Mucor mucedo TaxID=29922 RepID=UPI00221FB511|nr:uncharacterized protein EV154DRAFT_541627 [Mucor mucedo]KAI7896190.1 hypothetical protein EV154DRAFT_541627 [Mucor mucedo]
MGFLQLTFLRALEDEITISKHFTSYLTKTKVSDWKYEDVINNLLDLGFLPTDEDNDLQKLGSIFKDIATKLKNENSVTYSEAEHGKMVSVNEHMEYLYGILNLQHAKLPKRFNKYIMKMKDEAGIELKPFLVTLEERDMLVELSNCKNTSELETLLSTWYSKKNLSSNCKYIRFALSASVELWSTKALLNKTHEDWYRLHLETKRSECVSQVTKILKEAEKDVKLQRLDFILCDMNSDTDVLTVEEKPSVNGVKADIRKGDMLKKHALYLWSKQVGSSVLMEKLEAIYCQWQRSSSFPISSRHSPEFSKLLLAILSLKRTVKLNYAKFNLILEEKYKNEVKTLNFADDSALYQPGFFVDM